jgi:cell division protease FtsH
MDTKTPRSASPRDPSNRRLPRHLWWALALAAAAAPALAYVTFHNPARKISYGQFKKKLAAGEVLSVKVGTTELTGELKPSVRGARPETFRASRLGMERDEALPGLLDRFVPEGNYEAEAGPSVAQSVVLPSLVLAGMVACLWLVYQRAGGMGSAVAFARSKPRLYDKNERRVTFDDVAGNEEVVDELREVVEFLRTPEKFQKIGGRIPKGVLLVGPPGTGKTLLARAVAGEAGVPFFSLSGSDFVEMFVGVGAARVRSLFAQANTKAPCLIFIDELDALGKARGTGGPGNHDERDQTLNQLLVEMDGFDPNRGIILIAATNRPETLDPALVRPGRFDRQVVVDRPDITGREDILKVHVKSVALDDEINLRQVAAMTPGFVGADLANLVNEAALLAARKGKPKVGSLEFQEGVERVIAGPEKRQRVLLEEEKLRIAYHEAGHALVARTQPGTDPVHKVSILGRGNGALGYTMSLPETDRYLHTKTSLESTIRTLLGGTVAEEVVYGEVSDGATSDLQRATSIARKMVAEFGMSPRLGRVSYQTQGRNPFLSGGGANDYHWSEQTAREIDLEVRRVLDENLEATRQVLAQRREALDAIALRLMERESIDAAELQELIDRHPAA